MTGTRNILEACDTYDARLLFASSSEVYGDYEAEWLSEDLTEDHVIFHPNEYALSKWANERQILAFQARHGTDVTRLRFFNAYGPGEAFHPYRSVVALFCHKALAGEPLPVFQRYFRTFMHIDDFIPTLANACEKPLTHSVYNIGGQDYRSVEELANIVCDNAGEGEIDLIPEDTHNVRAKRPDISRAIVDLSHSPTIRLEEGVPDTLRLDAGRRGPHRGSPLSVAVRRALYGKMAGDTTLTNLLGDLPTGYTQNIYHQQAAKGAGYPYVIFNQQAATPVYAFLARAYDNDIWMVKAVDANPDSDPVNTIASRLDALLTDGTISISGRRQLLPAPRIRAGIFRNRRRSSDPPRRDPVPSDVRVGGSCIHAGTSSPPRLNSCILAS